MAYEKRLCVLKQVKKGFTADGAPLSGAVYAERLGDELTISPRLTGIAPVKEGRYAFSLWVGGQSFCMEVKGNSALRLPQAPSLKDGFAVLLCFVRAAGEPEPVAFGTCGAAPKAYETLLNVFLFGKTKKKGTPTPPMPLPPFETPIPTNPQAPRAPIPPLPEQEEDDEPFRDSLAAQYDDEAITATNYFDGVPSGDSHEGAHLLGEKAASSDGQEAPRYDADGTIRPFRTTGGGLTYYYEVREKFQEAFKKYPQDASLLKTFPQSEWVNVDGTLLGIVYKEGRPRYLCLATKQTPPPTWDSAVFVPVSEFSETDGYYVLFQDADTGEYVKVERA